MRAPQPITIGQTMQRLMAESPHQNKLAAATILGAWQQLMPTIVLQQTESAFVWQDKLFVKISSAPLRQELQSTKDLIYQRISAATPGCRIAEIVFL
ncbi:MAG: DciA family protein [Bacteroidota bacterium]